MNKILFFLFFPLFLYPQIWIDKMQDPSNNFYDIKKEFENYWSDKTIEKGKGWKQFKRWENFIEDRVYPDGKIRPEILFEEYGKLKESQNQSSIFLSNIWTQVGPDDVPLVASGGKRGIGRVNTIAFHPNDPNVIYVGAPAGGFWKSLDNGQNWTTTTDFLTNLGVSDIAINPNTPDEIYIITGDRDGGDTYSYGLMKSTDGGITFSLTGLSFNITNYYKGNRVLIDPNNTNTVIVATSNGIYRSVDSGNNFTLTYPGVNMTDIEFHTTNTNIVYGASKGNTSIYKSSDNGLSWIQSGSGLPSTGDVSRACVAVTIDNPQVVYALFGAQNNGFYAVYKSIDEGQNWVMQSNSPNLLGWSYDGTDSGGQAWYDLAFTVSPTNENVLFVGGVNCWKSNDGGQNWNLNTHWYGANGSTYMHADEHMFRYNPLNNHIYSGNDGGLYYSDDNGDNWTDISDGLHITQFYSLGVSQTVQDKVITGSQDNGTFLKTNLNWDAVIGGDGMECIIDYTDANIMYGALYYGDVRKSTNGGNSFSSIGPSNNGAWETPYELDKNDPNIIYIGYDELHRSDDGGNSWNIITSGETNGGKIDEIAISKSNSDRIYISDGSDMFRTINGGNSWDQIDVNGLPNKTISYILVNPNDENTVWVTLSGYTSTDKVYKSVDGGDNWLNITDNGLPNVPVNCIEMDNGNVFERIYIGTDLGVWTRDSTSGSWTPFNNNTLPNVIVNELEMQYQSNKLFAATYGRGLWSVDLPITMPPIANFSYTDSIFCMIPSDVSFSNNSFYSNSYYWDFGDGNTSSLANPVHTYTSFGTFTVSLVAIGPLGTDSIVKQQIISIDPSNDCIFTLPPDSAGTILTMCSGTLYDVGGPNGDYYDNSYAWITIEPPGSNQITLTFNLFDVEAPSSSSYCNWDYLEIFDGNNITTPSLGQYCNSLTGSPGTVSSSGGAITILMSSDAAVTENGFEADWTCTFPTSPPVSAFSVDSISCNPTIAFTDLSTNGPLSWLWDFGDGNTSSFQNPVHTYSSGGTYTVKLVTTNANGADSIIINNAITIIDVSLQTFDNSSCGPDSLDLIANSISGTINWYDNINLQNLLGTGNLFTTPILNTTTSYYVQSVYEFSSIYGGPSDNTIGNGSYNQGSNYLIFNTYNPAILISVLVYANSDAYRTIELRDNQGVVISDTTVFIPISNNGIRVYLNFDLPVQNNMQLGLSGSNNDLFRNNSGAVYPYNIVNILSVTGASNQSAQDNWYFLYDWEVSRPACISNILEVTATIDSNSSNTSYVTSCGPYLWGVDGVTYTSSGIYTYITTTSSGCTHIDTLNVIIGNNSSNNIQDVSFCDGDSVIVGENTYDSPGSYIDSLETVSGCDSIINTILTVFPNLTSNQNILLCLGDSVIVGSNTYTEEGSFVDTMISLNNCDSIVTTIIEFSDIDAEIVWNNNQLEVSILTGFVNNYLWSTGEITSIITPNSSGIYWCLVTDFNGCVSDTSFIEVGATSLFEKLKNSVKVFPNPTTGIVNIIFSNNVTAILNVQDVLGNDVYNDIITNDNSRTIDLSDYSSGVYILEFILESHIITNKIILE